MRERRQESRAARRGWRRRWLSRLVGATLAGAALQPAIAQNGADPYQNDAPLLPDAVSERDIEIRGRFTRQWRQVDNTLVIQVNGAFRLDFGKRQLTSDNAVVWLTPKRSNPDGRRYYELTVYLSGKAQVREPAGTTVEDNALLISNLRTFGRVVKYDDANAVESMEMSELYQKAVADRAAIEADLQQQESDVQTSAPQVKKPADPNKPRPRPRLIRYSLPRGTEPLELADGTPVQIATGRIYLSQSGGPDSPVIEIQADNAVIFPARESAGSLLGQEAASQPAGPPSESKRGEKATEHAPTTVEKQTGVADAKPVENAKRDKKSASQPSETIGAQVAGMLRAVYLEGDVVLSVGDRVVRASRLYYDFERQRAIMLDGVFRAELPDRGVPLYVRAEEIRQLSAREFAADNARVSTSEFYTPHYHVGAERVYIYDRTPRDASGQPSVNQVQGAYEMRNATLNLENVPIAYWPYSKGSFDASETLLRRLSAGYSDDFGVSVETAWYLFNLLGIEAPQGFDASLRLDYFSKRGPAVGIDGKYERPDSFGYFRSYYINDGGEDDFGPLRDNTPENANRGRLLWRHRQYLANNWQLTLEGSYVSDPGFMEEWRKNEWFNEKQQEQAIYLKRAENTEAITFLANWRSLDFVTQTEHLPELTYRRIGDTPDPFVTYSESRVGAVRYRPDDRRFFDNHRVDNTSATDTTARADSRNEAELPIKVPGWNFVPFATVRGSFWDGTALDDGANWRGMGIYGMRGATWLSKVYNDANSDLLDINRIRHVIQPNFAVWWGHSNTRSDLLTPFDEGVETVDAIYGTLIGVKQIWQIKRGEGDKQRTTDLLTLNTELGFFGGEDIPRDDQSNGWVNPYRPEDSRARNYGAVDLQYRITDTTSFLWDMNVDLDDGALDRNNLALLVERSPRLSYVLGYRHAGDINLDYVGGGFNYKLTEKHITGVRMWFDTDRGDVGEIQVTYIRKLPRWYLGFNVEFDKVFDDITFTVSLWPEGIPEWALGSKRFTGLGSSTEITPAKGGIGR